jgi:hypothetical protein
MWFICFDVFKFLYFDLFYFIYALAHVYMFSCIISLFLIYYSGIRTWKLQVRWGSNGLPYDFQSGFKFMKPSNS